MTPDNKALAKIFSIEYMLMALGVMFSIGMGYAALAATDKENSAAIKNVEAKVSTLTAKQDAVSKDVQDIKIGVATIRTNQDNQDEQIKELQEGMKEILRELRRQ